MNIKTDECIELKNLQYKTMLSGGNFNIETNVSDVNLLDKFLEDNKLHNLNDNWAKMDNTNKIKKFNNFSKKYIEDNNLSSQDFEKEIPLEDRPEILLVCSNGTELIIQIMN